MDMVYAQPSDMIARYPNRDLVQLTNEDPTQQVVDDSVLQQALADASAEIDGYLESRFTLPLSDAPAAPVAGWMLNMDWGAGNGAAWVTLLVPISAQMAATRLKVLLSLIGRRLQNAAPQFPSLWPLSTAHAQSGCSRWAKVPAQPRDRKRGSSVRSAAG